MTKLTDLQLRILRTLYAHPSVSFGGDKAIHQLSAARALTRKGLAMELWSSFFVITRAGREYIEENREEKGEKEE